jgi:hypothetical protein
MIARVLTDAELQWIMAQSQRLIAAGVPPDLSACSSDTQFAAIAPAWQLLILADMRFTISSYGERDG